MMSLCIYVQTSPHVQFALAVSSCLMTTNFAWLLSLLHATHLSPVCAICMYVLSYVQTSPHVQFALAVSSCLMTTNWVQLMRLLEGAPLLLAATAQVCVCVGGGACYTWRWYVGR